VTNDAEVKRLGRRDTQTALAKAIAAALVEAMGQTRAAMPASGEER
jgi:N-acetylmuramoyl-L-alanine amidase